jgi:spore coat protein U-like protein
MNRYVSLAAIAAALALGVSGAQALTSLSANLTVQAQVTTTCSVTATTLNFGTILASTTTATNASAPISIDCGVPYKLALGNGANYDMSNSKRQVHTGAGTGATSYMGYVLNDSTGNSWDNNALLNPPVSTVTVYGVLDAPVSGQLEGTYTDTVAMTLNY